MELSFLLGLGVVAGFLALILSGTMWMAQTKATYYEEGDDIDYTPASAVTAGDVIALGTNLIGIAKLDIAANALGAVAVAGIFKVPKATGAISRGDPVYWNSVGSPVTGTASSGAAGNVAGAGIWMGTAAYAAASGDSYVYTILNSSAGGIGGGSYPPSAIAAAGANQATATNTNYGYNNVAGADATKGVILPTPQPGRSLIIRNSSTGGALKVYPQLAGTINEAAANTNYALANYTSAMFIPNNATGWNTLPLVAS